MNFENLQLPTGNLLKTEENLQNFYQKQNCLQIFKTGTDYVSFLSLFLSLFNAEQTSISPEILADETENSKTHKIFVIYDGSTDFQNYFLKIFNKISINLHQNTGQIVFITNETGGTKRKKIYESAAIIFITSRILVVDLLKGDLAGGSNPNAAPAPAKKSKKSANEKLSAPVLDFRKISGILLLDPENLSEKTQVPFIIRILKENRNIVNAIIHETIFFKAISNQPKQLLKNGLETIMNNLNLDCLNLETLDFLADFQQIGEFIQDEIVTVKNASILSEFLKTEATEDEISENSQKINESTAEELVTLEPKDDLIDTVLPLLQAVFKKIYQNYKKFNKNTRESKLHELNLRG